MSQVKEIREYVKRYKQRIRDAARLHKGLLNAEAIAKKNMDTMKERLWNEFRQEVIEARVEDEELKEELRKETWRKGKLQQEMKDLESRIVEISSFEDWKEFQTKMKKKIKERLKRVKKRREQSKQDSPEAESRTNIDSV
jgi:hypothetical protein